MHILSTNPYLPPPYHRPSNEAPGARHTDPWCRCSTPSVRLQRLPAPPWTREKSLFTLHINTSSFPPPFFSFLSLPRNFCPTLRSVCLWPLFYSRYRSIAHISSKTGTPLDLHTDRFCDRPPEAPVLATANEPEQPIAIHQNVVGYLCSGNGHSNLHVMVEAPTA